MADSCLYPNICEFNSQKNLVRKLYSPILLVLVCIYACHSTVTLIHSLCIVKIIVKNFNYASEDTSSPGETDTWSTCIFESNFP